MSIEKLTVGINFSGREIEVGELVLSGRQIYFKYFADYLNMGLNLSPIKMPFDGHINSADPKLFEGLYGVFHDSLPDSWGKLLLDRMIVSKGIPSEQINPLDRLAYVGSTGMGALTYHPSIDDSQSGNDEIDLDNLFNESQRVISGIESDIIDELFHLGGSSGGARPKVLVGANLATREIIHGSQDLPEGFDHWLIKFAASVDRPDIANIETAYFRMAKEVGIEVPESTLFQGNSDKQYFGVKRFDRNGSNRLHMHSASGLMHDDHRYSQLDYGHIMDCAFQLEKSVVAYEKVFRLATFNVYSHNRDDHSKNFAFLMDQEGSWRFSPAYDLTYSSSSYGMHSTAVAGESQNPGMKKLMKIGKRFNLEQA